MSSYERDSSTMDLFACCPSAGPHMVAYTWLQPAYQRYADARLLHQLFNRQRKWKEGGMPNWSSENRSVRPGRSGNDVAIFERKKKQYIPSAQYVRRKTNMQNENDDNKILSYLWLFVNENPLK